MTAAPDPRRFLPLTHLEYHLLAALVDGPEHGYALVQRIRERSDGFINPGTGSFYSIVKKLADEGLIDETAGETGGGRRRCYAISPLGRKVLVAETSRLRAQLSGRRISGAAWSRGPR